MDKPAFPLRGADGTIYDLGWYRAHPDHFATGMTLREFYAGMALQGLCANPDVMTATLANDIHEGIRGGRPIKVAANALADIMINED